MFTLITCTNYQGFTVSSIPESSIKDAMEAATLNESIVSAVLYRPTGRLHAFYLSSNRLPATGTLSKRAVMPGESAKKRN